MLSLRWLQFSAELNGSKSLSNIIFLLSSEYLCYCLQNGVCIWEYLPRLVILPISFGEVSSLNKDEALVMEKENIH